MIQRLIFLLKMSIFQLNIRCLFFSHIFSRSEKAGSFSKLSFFSKTTQHLREKVNFVTLYQRNIQENLFISKIPGKLLESSVATKYYLLLMYLMYPFRLHTHLPIFSYCHHAWPPCKKYIFQIELLKMSCYYHSSHQDTHHPVLQ